MGVLPLQFSAGASAGSLGLTGREEFALSGVAAIADDGPLPRRIRVSADGREFETIARIDTPFEREVFLAGGILPYTLRRLSSQAG
jgi:aconitate hydratase